MSMRSLVFALLVASQAVAWSATSANAAVTSSPAPKAAAKPARSPLDRKALDILKASSETIQAAQTLSFTATELFESLTRQGHPLASATRYEVTMARPNKLRIITPGDGPSRQYYYDGKTVTGYAPTQNLFASASAPATVDAMFQW